MWLDKEKMISTVIVIFIIFCFYIVYSCVQKKYHEEYLVKNYKNNKVSIKINTLTNFQWDYVDFFVVNVDLQKVKFYRNRDIIFEKEIVIDAEGELLSQVLFTTKNKSDLINFKDQILYYRCHYLDGRLKFVNTLEIKRSDGNNRYLYFYQPSNCKAVSRSLHERSMDIQNGNQQI